MGSTAPARFLSRGRIKVIQFKNGNLIINRYSADGQKQRSDNYTRLTAITPVGENTVVNPENGYNDAVYSYTGTAYIGGFEYNISKTKYQGYGGVWIYSDVFNPVKIYTPEGYIDNLSTSGTSIVSNGVRYNYYRKDHLGNIREVWNGVRKNYSNQVKELASTRQRTQYYPSGLPWAESTGASVQKRKYNGKEFIEMHGLDEYDSEARWHYPAIMRTTTIDPLAEKYYSISPYAWCGNNPVKFVDPDGRSTKVRQNENGTYTVIGGDLNDKDKNIYVYTQDKKGEYTVKGESIGESALLTSFYNSDEGNWSIGSIINPYDESGIVFFNSFNNEEPTITDYMENATGGEKYDFKRVGTIKGGENDNPIYYYRGMPIKFEKGKTIYSSARDIGNYTAGYIVGHLQLKWNKARKQFDKLESQQKGYRTVEGYSTQNAQWHGWTDGINSSYDNPWKTLRWTIKSIPGGVLWLFKKN